MVGNPLREGTRIRKPLPKTDALGPWARNGSATLYTPWMEDVGTERDGALFEETRRGNGVPGRRKGPPKATGGHPSSKWGTRIWRKGKTTTGQISKGKPQEETRPLNLLQWNAEGIYNKKLPLLERLHTEKIDVACIQETHLNPNNRFQVRGYQPFRLDREGRHKGGVLILVRNDLPAQEFSIDTQDQAEIQGVKITVQERTITVYNLYCPTDKKLSLQSMNIPSENCLVVGDFNSHSTCWGYAATDKRGEEVEDWQIDTRLILLNDPEDTPTFFSRRWLTTSTPDLAFSSDNLAMKTSRHILKQLGGSDHRPVKLSIDLLYKPELSKCFPRWNYKKADWNRFSKLSDKYIKSTKKEDKNINRLVEDFNKAVMRAAAETIPRGARKNYKPYWTEELKDLEDEVNKCRQEVEENPTIQNNITLKATTAKYRKEYNKTARINWKEKTESLNFDRDGNKLWKLTKALNDETTRMAQIAVQQNNELVTGQRAANCFIDNYERISSLNVPEERKRQVKAEQITHRQDEEEEEEEDCMIKDFTMIELDDTLKKLKGKKSPGPDQISNEMLLHLGTKAKKRLLGICNSSWRTGSVPQTWRTANMIPIHKKGKDRNQVDSYRPISLTSCVGKVMERLVNERLTWLLEKNQVLCQEQAGFRSHRSTEDQVTYIAQKIEDGFQDKKSTVAVWIDMEKAFDKVWKLGLKLKLQQSGISGNMYRWISQYLNNRKARVHVNGKYSREKTLKEGLPQGGVLSPTLFLIFINDILQHCPRNVKGAIYADDLALWCTEEYVTTATYRLQEALRMLETWTKTWMIAINPTKTTYTIFSLSPKEVKVKLSINGQELPKEDNPTYLGVMFDKRLTWKSQTEKTESRAKTRLALMKKLTATTWGADANILKKLYVGRVRPVLEYGSTAWGTAAKSNLDNISRVQNQATRIITGAMRSTPIQAMETTTGLESMEDRRDTKVLLQSAKLRRLNGHPMSSRMEEPTKGRLKRESFIHQARKLEERDLLTQQKTEKIPKFLEIPRWKIPSNLQVYCTIPDIEKKGEQADSVKKSLTLEHIDNLYPMEKWTQVYTDGSAERAVANGGAGVFIKFPCGKEERIYHATGLHSTNYKAETEAIKTGALSLMNSTSTSQNIVFLSDAKSVLQAVQSGQDKTLNDVIAALSNLCTKHTVAMQWIPAHCGIKGNELADSLAKLGSEKQQESKPTNLKEAKTMIKANQHTKWLEKHQNYNANDPFYNLERADQVIIFRLRTGHNRLNYHLFRKFNVGQTDQCPCQEGSMTVEHILQSCPTHERLRQQSWMGEVPTSVKLYGGLEDLRITAAFIRSSNVSI